jgi:DNA-binding response OmpR family regulator
MRVLIVDDQEQLAKTVAQGLRREGMAVDVALDGETALDKARVTVYDVIVLDRGLPDTSGDDVCRTLVNERVTSRILMLTAATTVADRVEGLGLGADDYLAKPFDFPELVARIRALGRRTGLARPPLLQHEDLIVDPALRTAFRSHRPLTLSPKEFAVLEYLLFAEGRVVSAEELLDHVWDDATDPWTTTVKTTVGRLRHKLGNPPIITTVREGGYRI